MSVESAFWKIHEGLPRQAPGSDASTKHLLELAGLTTGKGLEIGCGQGRASLILAKAGVELTATDTHQPFLDELNAEAKVKNLGDTLTACNMPMEALDFPDETFDLVWAEGSAYVIGWDTALKSWKRPIKRDGLLVATECCWLTTEHSVESQQFWSHAYPGMLTIDRAKKVAIENGYTVLDSYTLPASDWWDEYYNPLLEKIKVLRLNADENMNTALDMTQREINMYQKYSEEYGYVGFILKKR